MIRFLFFIFISTHIIACKNDFYSYKKDGDLWRFPLLEPYELISPTKDDWFIKIKDFNPYPFESNRPYQVSYIDSIGLVRNLIFIHSLHANLPNGSRPIWLIIEEPQHEKPKILICEEKDFFLELKKRNLKDTLVIYSADKLITDFQSSLKLPEQWLLYRKRKNE